MQKQLRLLLVENQTLVRLGIKTALAASSDFEIVGEAASGAAGLAMFEKLRPDVVILSLRLPDSCAVDSIGDYLYFEPTARILVLAESAGDAEVSRSLKKGALGFVCKDVSAEELERAVRTIAAGKRYLTGKVAEILNENFGQEELTATEKSVLEMIVKGFSNKQIARAARVTENTVKSHVKNIFDKMGVSDRTTASTLAIKRGLVRIN